MATAAWPDDCLPPEAYFESRQALIQSINAWALPRGYAFVMKKSVKERDGRTTVTYACDRSRRPPTSPLRKRQRRTTTRMTNCPFSVLVRELSDGSWKLQYRFNQAFAVYNYEPSLHPSAYPVHRQLSEGAVSQVTSLANAGIALKDIQTIVWESGGGLIATRQDIYNWIVDVR